jgi:hypothetical protein
MSIYVKTKEIVHKAKIVAILAEKWLEDMSLNEGEYSHRFLYLPEEVLNGSFTCDFFPSLPFSVFFSGVSSSE